MSDAKSTLAAAAILSVTMVGSAAAAIPVSNLANVAKPSTGIQHVFYRPLIWHRPLVWHRPIYGYWRRPLVWHRPIYGFYGARRVWHRPIYGFYGPHRFWHRGFYGRRF